MRQFLVAAIALPLQAGLTCSAANTVYGIGNESCGGLTCSAANTVYGIGNESCGAYGSPFEYRTHSH
jgi:hypothetical protein